MSGRIDGRKAVVTGGAQGLGCALAERLAREGADVLIADVNVEAARDAARSIAGETGRRVVATHTDVTDATDVRDMVDTAVRELGGLDILVANAGILVAGESTELGADSWRKVIDVNLTGYFLCAREALRVMAAQGRGVVIQINSKSGKLGSFRNAAYSASKFGGVGLTQSLALEFADKGIRVNAICLGNLLDSPLWVDSLYEQYAARLGITREEVRQRYIDKVPMKRGCTYNDVANVMIFLASDESSYMTGQAINVTGGQEMR